MSRRAAMRSFGKPWLAKRTILARMTSRYGDVYCRARLSSSECSSSERLIMKGLFLGILHSFCRGQPIHIVISQSIKYVAVFTKSRTKPVDFNYLKAQLQGLPNAAD